MNRSRFASHAVFGFVVVAMTAGAAAAQVDTAPVPVGTIVERIAAQPDTTRSYALYLPSSYDPARPWPILYAMDPRGRALIPLRIFRDAAERLGYIVVSSYDTRSDQDDAMDVNYAGLEAMLADTQRRFNLDGRRLYLAGFSGTARSAWDFARMLSGNVPGIIGFGAGFPFPSASVLTLWDSSLVFFGGSGLIDFNYEEMRALAFHLTRFGFRHRLEFYPGPHSWPGADVAGAALEWMEMQAMRRGLAPADPAWLAEYAGRLLDRARRIEEGGDTFEAREQYAALVTDLEGLTDVEAAHTQLQRLNRDDSVRRERSRRDRLAREDADFRKRLGRFLERVQKDRDPPSLERAQTDLKIEDLVERAGNAEDRTDALAAQRMLELAFVRFAFYEPERYFPQGAFERALAVLQVARIIKPERADVCFNLARAHARLGQSTEAFADLDCAVDRGWRNVDVLRSHPDLESLRSLPAYRALLDRLTR